MTQNTKATPARSCTFSYSLSEETSAAIIATCRRNKVTFGSALPVCAQVAFARVLHRQYARGEISLERWEQMRREPHHVCGPVNIRSFLNPDWFMKGGKGDLCLSIGFFHVTLPYVPLGDVDPNSHSEGLEPPALSSMLSSARFFLRCNIIRRQMAALVQDPLFLDINNIRAQERAQAKREVLQQWRVIQQASGTAEPIIPSRDVSHLSTSMVFAHGYSTMGNVSIPTCSCDYSLK